MDDSQVSLRPMTDKDLPFLRRVYASTRLEELSVTGWSKKEIDAFLDMQFNAQHTYYQEHYAKASYNIILLGETMAGRLYVDRRKDELRIVDIALLSEFRGKGIGSGLLKKLMREAAVGGKLVRIHVEGENPAMALYTRLGFKHVDDYGVYHLMEWKPGGNST